MKTIKTFNKIIYYDIHNFNVNQTLDCGQIFRYIINDKYAVVYSKDKMAKIYTYADRIEILTDEVNYFYHFFDFDTDYTAIKNELKKDKFLSNAVDYGYGIRILNNDCFEMLVSFIISANNNISRIKKSVEYLCTHFGENKGEYYAFPSLTDLKKASILDFQKAGLGYRANQLYDTISQLNTSDIEQLKTLNKDEQFKYLVSLKGVGEKVANCILLFGLGVKDVFPVDTWINKVYNALTNSNETNRKLITQKLSQRYGKLSGYAQQYFYYYFREQNIK